MILIRIFQNYFYRKFFRKEPSFAVMEKKEIDSCDNMLQLKLNLLQHLQKGNYQEVQGLITKIKQCTKINKEMYSKFSDFIEKNSAGLLQMDRQEKQQKCEQFCIENVQQQQCEQNSSLSSQAQSEQEQIQESEYSNINQAYAFANQVKSLPFKQKNDKNCQKAKSKQEQKSHQCIKNKLNLVVPKNQKGKLIQISCFDRAKGKQNQNFTVKKKFIQKSMLDFDSLNQQSLKKLLQKPKVYKSMQYQITQSLKKQNDCGNSKNLLFSAGKMVLNKNRATKL